MCDERRVSKTLNLTVIFRKGIQIFVCPLNGRLPGRRFRNETKLPVVPSLFPSSIAAVAVSLPLHDLVGAWAAGSYKQRTLLASNLAASSSISL